MSDSRPALAVANPWRRSSAWTAGSSPSATCDQVLLVADPDFALSVAFGQIGHRAHLGGGGIARHCAMRLEADGDDPVTRHLVGGDIGVGPGAEHRIRGAGGVIRGLRHLGQRGRREMGGDPGQLGGGGGRIEVRRDLGEARLDQIAHPVDPDLVHRDLDARLVFVVAPAQ